MRAYSGTSLRTFFTGHFFIADTISKYGQNHGDSFIQNSLLQIKMVQISLQWTTFLGTSLCSGIHQDLSKSCNLSVPIKRMEVVECQSTLELFKNSCIRQARY